MPLHDLPQNNYRWSAFALLTPGVVNDSNGYGLLSFRGQSTLLNNVTIDGTDDNQAYFSEERGRTRAGYSTIKAAVQEFQVNTSNYSVEYGRSAGGIVNSVTKSGTNRFHGEGYYYDRDSAWAAQNALRHAPGAGFGSPITYAVQSFKPTDLRRQYGFAVGGPDPAETSSSSSSRRTSSITTFPAAATITGTSANANFYTAADRMLPSGKTCGVSSGCSGAELPGRERLPDCDDDRPDLRKPLRLIQRGHRRADLDAGHGAAHRRPDDLLPQDRLAGKPEEPRVGGSKPDALDFSGRHPDQPRRWPTACRASATTMCATTGSWASWTAFSRTRVSNEARYMYGRDFEYEFNQTPTPYEAVNLVNTPTGYTNPQGLPPNVYLSGFFQFGTPQFLNRAALPDERRWQISDTVDWVHGNHTLQVRRGLPPHRRSDFKPLQPVRRLHLQRQHALGNYLSDLYLSQNPVAGKTAENYTYFNQGAGSAGLDFTTGDYSLFAQDEWKSTRG